MAKLTGNNLKYVAERLVSLSKYGTQWLGVKCHSDAEAKETASRISTIYGGTSVKDGNPAQQAGGWLTAGLVTAGFNNDKTFWVKFKDGSTRKNAFDEIQASVAKYLEENEVGKGSEDMIVETDTPAADISLEEEPAEGEPKAGGNTKTLLIVAGVALAVIVLAVVLFKKD